MRRLRLYIFPFFLVVFVFALYLSTLNYAFVSDDIPGIVQTGASWTWTSVFTGITFLTHWTGILQFILYQFVGPSPWAYRLVNILCHAVSVLLVYGIVFQLTNQIHGSRIAGSVYPSKPWRSGAFFAASLFAVHPMIIESVTWISGGIYAQYGMFFLLSFWLYQKSDMLTRDTKIRNTNIYTARIMWYFMSLVTYIFSLFFSEKALVLFFTFPLYELCFGNLKKSWKKMIPYVALSTLFILFYAMKIEGRLVDVATVGGGKSLGWYNPFFQIPYALTTYMELFVYPKALTLYHAGFVVTSVNTIIRIIITLIYISIIIWTWVKKQRFFTFWLLFFLIPLLPTLTPLKIAWVVAERYAYLPTIAACVLCVYGVEAVIQYAGPARIARVQWLSTLLFIGIITAFSIRTITRNRDWESEDTLWIATSITSPTVPYTWNNMGDLYSRAGDEKKASEMFLRAISLNPRYADAYHNLGTSYIKLGEIEQGIASFEKALEFNPNLWQSHQTLAVIYYSNKDYQKALYHIKQALKIVPENTTLRHAEWELTQMKKK